jgi:hypothetical protein
MLSQIILIFSSILNSATLIGSSVARIHSREGCVITATCEALCLVSIDLKKWVFDTNKFSRKFLILSQEIVHIFCVRNPEDGGKKR